MRARTPRPIMAALILLVDANRTTLGQTHALLAGSAVAHVLDVSYGGLRLAFPNPLPESSTTFAVTLPATQLSFEAHRVWSHDAPTGAEVWCGVEFADPEGAEARTWRAFVDSLT